MSDSTVGKQNVSEEKQKRVTLATPLGKEELAVSVPNQRNWRGILIALLVIVAVLGLIICSILLLSPPEDGPRVKGVLFSLETIANKKFLPNLFNGTWISDLELVYRDNNGNIKMFCVENFTTKSLMTNATFDLLKAVDYKVSADLNYILIMTDVINVWKYSFLAKYFVYEVSTEEYFPLKTSEEDGEAEEIPYLEAAEWAPTGNAIVFIYKNNLYYKSRIRKPQVYTLTRNGAKDVFFNGRPDFLYESKILESAIAFWFSPDSSMLAFASFNCSLVGELQYPHYGTSKYEQVRSIRYPKVGTNIPKVELTIVNMTYPKILKTSLVQPPQIYAKDSEYYLTGVKWINSNDIVATWMNRRQNLTSISVCKHPNWVCVDIYQDFMSDSWVSKIPNPIFEADGTWFLAILPLQDGTRGRFQELCQVDSASRKFIYLTSPPMIVLDISAWDRQNHIVYFIATLEPGSRHLFKTGDRNSSQRSWDCLTCFYDNRTSFHSRLNYINKTKLDNETHYGYYKSFLVNVSLEDNDRSPHCLFSKVYFNSIYNPKYYVLDCLGPEVPSNAIFDATTNSVVTVLNANSDLRTLFSSMAVPQTRKFQVELESGFHAQVRLYLPPGLREYEEITFPLILHVDSSPGSQLVNEKFQVDWWWYLSGKRNFIIAEIDARGTGYQGEKLVREITNRIGAVESEDQIAVMTYLKDTLKFIDKHRIGIFGRGYGGYLAASIMSQDKDLFRCGVAVNPITNFLFTALEFNPKGPGRMAAYNRWQGIVFSWLYKIISVSSHPTGIDAFSTERFMGHPNHSDRDKAYEESDLNRKAGNLKGKEFLLVSSTADVEVPIQHTMHLVHNLVKENVIFKQQVYPDEDHELSGVAMHYYSLMDAFWNECFIPPEVDDWDTLATFTPFTRE